MEKTMTYENAIKEIEEIIEKLSTGNLPLKESTELFSRAGELVKFAQKELSKTTGKLTEIKKMLDGSYEEV